MWQPELSQMGWILPYVAGVSVGILAVHLLFPRERVGWKVGAGCAIAVAVLAGATYFLSAADVPVAAISITAVLACTGVLLLLIVVLGRWRQKREVSARRLTGDYRWMAVAAAAVSIFALATPWAMSAPLAESTEFFITESADRMPPWRREIPLDEPISITVGVRVRGAVARELDLIVRTDGAQTQTIALGTLDSPAYVEAPVTLPPRDQEAVLYEFLLLSPDSSTPYRRLSFWAVSTPASP